MHAHRDAVVRDRDRVCEQMGVLSLDASSQFQRSVPPTVVLRSTKPRPDFGDRLIRKIRETVT